MSACCETSACGATVTARSARSTAATGFDIRVGVAGVRRYGRGNAEQETDTMLPPRERVVMVSGASRGIGRAVAQRLHEDGYRLSLGMRSSPAATETARTLDADRLLVAPYEARAAQSAPDWDAASLA